MITTREDIVRQELVRINALINESAIQTPRLSIPHPDEGATPESWNNLRAGVRDLLLTLDNNLQTIRGRANDEVRRADSLVDIIELRMRSVQSKTGQSGTKFTGMEFTETFQDTSGADTSKTTASIDAISGTLSLGVVSRQDRTGAVSTIALRHGQPGNDRIIRGLGHINGIPDLRDNNPPTPDERDVDDQLIEIETLSDLFRPDTGGIEIEQYIRKNDTVYIHRRSGLKSWTVYSSPVENFIRDHIEGSLRRGNPDIASETPETFTGYSIVWTLKTFDGNTPPVLTGTLSLGFAQPTGLDHVWLEQASVRGNFAEMIEVSVTLPSGQEEIVWRKDDKYVKGATHSVQFTPRSVVSVTWKFVQSAYYVPEFGMKVQSSQTGYFVVSQYGATEERKSEYPGLADTYTNVLEKIHTQLIEIAES